MASREYENNPFCMDHKVFRASSALSVYTTQTTKFQFFFSRTKTEQFTSTPWYGVLRALCLADVPAGIVKCKTQQTDDLFKPIHKTVIIPKRAACVWKRNPMGLPLQTRGDRTNGHCGIEVNRLSKCNVYCYLARYRAHNPHNFTQYLL